VSITVMVLKKPARDVHPGAGRIDGDRVGQRPDLDVAQHLIVGRVDLGQRAADRWIAVLPVVRHVQARAGRLMAAPIAL
jgi:hypothetical protein